MLEFQFFSFFVSEQPAVDDKSEMAGGQAQEEAAEMAEAMGSILSDKDKDVDTFLLHMAEKLCKEFEGDDNGRVTTVAEEKMQMLLDLTDERLAGISLTLEHKFGSMLKRYITLCQERKASRALSRVKVPPRDLKTTAENYRQCFSSYIDSPYVTYAATCERELGKLSLKDAFVLHFWCMLNCYRAKGDQMFAVSVCGVSSVGKSSLFESPAFENGHSYVAEAGVGRFAVKKRSTLIYSDISLDALYKSKDAAKFRTIARSEPTTCKVFADTCTLPPLWVLITSNQRIHSHVLPPDSKNFLAPTVLPSQLVVTEAKRKLLEESLAAVKNRVIECYCRKRPEIDPSCLPTHGSFGRVHFLLGAYSYVISLLQKYGPDAFYSPMMLKYVFTSLCDNMELYERVMDDSKLQRRRLVSLLRKLVPCDEERLSYMNALRKEKREEGVVEDDGVESSAEKEEGEELEEGELTAEDVEVKTEPTGEEGETEQCKSAAETNTRKRQRRKSLGRPAKKNRFVDSDITDSESEDDNGDFSVHPESLSGTSSSSSECDTDCNDSTSSDSSSSNDDTRSSNSSGEDEEEDREGFTCNFETQRFQQDAQEFI